MNIEEVRKAADRVGRYINGTEPLDRIYGDIHPDELGVYQTDRQRLVEWAIAELDRREKELAERALPLLGNVVLGFFDESDAWRVEHVITGVGKTAILLTDRRDGEQVMLECIKTHGQLDYLLAALKGGET